MAAIIHVLRPIVAHRRLMAACGSRGTVRERLVNGIIEEDSAGHQRVRIFCDNGQADQIFEFIGQTHPELATFINRQVFFDVQAEVGRRSVTDLKTRR